MNIIPIQQSTIGNRVTQAVDARKLHGKLEVGRDFSTWVKGRIDEYGFVEGEDFCCSPVSGSSENQGVRFNSGMLKAGSNKIDYTLTVQMAKELAMLESNDIGRQVRRYFIAAEEELQRRLEVEHKAQLKALEAEHDNDLEIAAHKINLPGKHWLKDVIKAQKQVEIAEGAQRYAEVRAEVQAEVLAVLEPMLPDLPKNERRELEDAMGWMRKTLKDFERGKFISTRY